MTEKPLSGQVCLVTGATRGIGKGIALQLGQAGATVYITGMTIKMLVALVLVLVLVLVLALLMLALLVLLVLLIMMMIPTLPPWPPPLSPNGDCIPDNTHC